MLSPTRFGPFTLTPLSPSRNYNWHLTSLKDLPEWLEKLGRETARYGTKGPPGRRPNANRFGGRDHRVQYTGTSGSRGGGSHGGGNYPQGGNSQHAAVPNATPSIGVWNNPPSQKQSAQAGHYSRPPPQMNSSQKVSGGEQRSSRGRNTGYFANIQNWWD